MNLNMIEGSYTNATPDVYIATIYNTQLSEYFPAAKIGQNNYIYVYSGYWAPIDNYFGLSAVATVSGGQMSSTPALTVRQAYNIDAKIDDGLPQSGNVIARYLNGSSGWGYWAAGGGNQGATSGGHPTNSATSGSSTTCYDNNGVTGIQRYSLAQNNGGGINCALSFKFQ